MARTNVELVFSAYAAFPAAGNVSKLYISTDTNKLYRWDGSSYVEVSA